MNLKLYLCIESANVSKKAIAPNVERARDYNTPHPLTLPPELGLEGCALKDPSLRHPFPETHGNDWRGSANRMEHAAARSITHRPRLPTGCGGGTLTALHPPLLSAPVRYTWG